MVSLHGTMVGFHGATASLHGTIVSLQQYNTIVTFASVLEAE
jgi:hypothetical protein